MCHCRSSMLGLVNGAIQQLKVYCAVAMYIYGAEYQVCCLSMAAEEMALPHNTSPATHRVQDRT